MVLAMAGILCNYCFLSVLFMAVNTKRKELDRLPETKDLCAQIPLELYGLVNEAKAQTNQNTNEYITCLLTEYYQMRKNRGSTVGASTLVAFQKRFSEGDMAAILEASIP